MKDQKPHRSFNGGGKKARIVAVIIGIIILIIVAVIANKILTAGDSAQADRLTEVAKAETELVRVSTLGLENAKSREALTLAATTKLSVQSSQVQTKRLLEKRGVNGKDFGKRMATSKNAKTDTQLTEAGRNNRYDETFTTIINKQLTDYQKLLKAANDSGKPAEKKVIEKSFKSAGMLLPKKSSSSSEDNTTTEE